MRLKALAAAGTLALAFLSSFSVFGQGFSPYPTVPYNKIQPTDFILLQGTRFTLPNFVNLPIITQYVGANLAFSGDCSGLSASLVCTMTNGVAFSSLATTPPGSGVVTALETPANGPGGFVTSPVAQANLGPITATGGTTALSFAARAGFSLSVADYGAKCDGSTDDTTAVNSAISAQGSLALSIPAVCKVSGTVNFTGPVVFGPRGQLACGASNVTFRSVLEAPRQQIFASSCTPGFWSSTRPHTVAYPEWWGGAGDSNGTSGNGTDNTTPFNNALASGVQVLDFACNSYYRFTTLSTTRSNITLQGCDRGSTHLVQDDPTGVADGLFFNGHSGQITIKNLALDRAQTGVGSLAAAYVVNGGASCPTGTTATLNSGTNTTPAVVTVATDDGAGHALTLNVTTAGAYTIAAPRTATLTTTPAIVPSALSGSCAGLTIKPLWAGPALIHTQDTYQVSIKGNFIGGSTNSWDGIFIDTSANTNSKNYIEDNLIFNGEHDGVNIRAMSSFEIADIFVGPNNYIQGFKNAGVEGFRNLNGIFVNQSAVYNNNYGLYFDADTYGTAMGSNKFRENDLDTNGSGNYFYGPGITLFQDNWSGGTPLICALCQAFQANGNHFAYNGGAAVTLSGSTGVNLSGIFINGGAANPILLQPLGSTQTTAVNISGVYSPGPGTGYLLTASGSPSNVSVNMRLPTGVGLLTGSVSNFIDLGSDGVVSTAGYTVSTLPSTIKGARAYVTDATSCALNGALTGGGSTFCPVIFNGSAWVGG